MTNHEEERYKIIEVVNASKYNVTSGGSPFTDIKVADLRAAGLDPQRVINTLNGSDSEVNARLHKSSLDGGTEVIRCSQLDLFRVTEPDKFRAMVEGIHQPIETGKVIEVVNASKYNVNSGFIAFTDIKVADLRAANLDPQQVINTLNGLNNEVNARLHKSSLDGGTDVIRCSQLDLLQVTEPDKFRAMAEGIHQLKEAKNNPKNNDQQKGWSR